MFIQHVRPPDVLTTELSGSAVSLLLYYHKHLRMTHKSARAARRRGTS